jgi:hypothetical protein
MRLFDVRCDVRVGDRPQRRHRLERGEGQVIAGNRLDARTRLLGDGGGDLAGINRVSAISLRKNSRATLVRTRARTAVEVGSSPSCPAAACSAAIRFATSTRKGLASPA